MIHLYHSRDASDRWSILPFYFQSYFESRVIDQTFKGYFTVAVEPFPPIPTVDEVMWNIPIGYWLHIFRIELIFCGTTYYIGLRTVVYTRRAFSTLLITRLRYTTASNPWLRCHINFIFDHWLRTHSYNSDRPLPLHYPFHVIFGSDASLWSFGRLWSLGLHISRHVDKKNR
ncbi:hypothetical protein Hanom_Chr09g00848941 [Helianthus anomalus]